MPLFDGKFWELFKLALQFKEKYPELWAMIWSVLTKKIFPEQPQPVFGAVDEDHPAIQEFGAACDEILAVPDSGS